MHAVQQVARAVAVSGPVARPRACAALRLFTAQGLMHALWAASYVGARQAAGYHPAALHACTRPAEFHASPPPCSFLCPSRRQVYMDTVANQAEDAPWYCEMNYDRWAGGVAGSWGGRELPCPPATRLEGPGERIKGVRPGTAWLRRMCQAHGWWVQQAVLIGCAPSFPLHLSAAGPTPAARTWMTRRRSSSCSLRPRAGNSGVCPAGPRSGWNPAGGPVMQCIAYAGGLAEDLSLLTGSLARKS